MAADRGARWCAAMRTQCPQPQSLPHPPFGLRAAANAFHSCEPAYHTAPDTINTTITVDITASRSVVQPKPRARPPVYTIHAAPYANASMYTNWTPAHFHPIAPPPASRTVMADVLMHISAKT